jgi:hypothetical protein
MACIESNHGPVVFTENLGDGDARITLHAFPTLDGPQVTVALTGDEVEALHAALSEVLDDY